MKKLILLCMLFIGTQFLYSQERENLNKEQTMDYIEKLIKSSFFNSHITMIKVELDGETVKLTNSVGKIFKENLLRGYDLRVTGGTCGYVVFWDDESSNYPAFIGCLRSYDDGNRLRNALEHLIEIIKKEKDTDPFR